jgi:predicted permease
MSHLFSDFRHSLRLLGGAPGFSAVAVLILALGIGANTAVFSVVNTLALQPRPGRIDSLASLYSRDRDRPDSFRDFSHPLYRDLRERRDIFDSLLAHTFSLVGIGDGEAMNRAFVEVVSANYFSTLGVRLAAGREFSDAEERPGANAPVAIASYGAWRQSGYDPGFVGSSVRVNGADFTVVGVAPRGFAGTMTMLAPQWWFPLGSYDILMNEMFRLTSTGLDDRANHALNLAGALRPGLTREAAEQALNSVGERIGREYPATDRDRAFVLTGVPRLGVSSSPRQTEAATLDLAAALLTLMAALVLVVACLNLANLLLARGAARRREIAIRQALGSGRMRIIQQLLVEGFTLAFIGAALGVLLSWWSTRALGAWLSAVLPLGVELVVEPSPRMLVAAVALAVFSTVVFALGPAWRLSRPTVTGELKGEPGQIARRFRSGSALVGAQVAVSLALVAVGGLFMRGAIKAAGATPGFALERQLVISFDPSLAGYSETRTRESYRRVLQRVRALPGVERASLASTVPYDEFSEGGRASLPNGTEETEVYFTIITSDYFETLGLPILRGRGFSADEDERSSTMAPALVNDRFARRVFGDDDPVGRPVTLYRGTGRTAETYLVAGIVPSVRTDLYDVDPPPQLYATYGSRFRAAMFLHVAVARGQDEAALLGTIQRDLRQMDSRLPVLSARTMTTQRDVSLTHWAARAAAVVFSTFGALALLLAAIGVYGLKAYEVARRTREIGIRIALGATAGNVTTLVLRDGLLTALAGLAIGFLLALGLGRLVSSLLYQVSPFDPVTMTVAAAALAGATLVATYLPARRATRIAPIEALRSE